MSAMDVWIVQEMMWGDGEVDDIRGVFSSREAADAWVSTHNPVTNRHGEPSAHFEVLEFGIEGGAVADTTKAGATDLLPAESMFLTVALAQVLRGEDAAPNVVAVCILALARLTGRHDWTASPATPDPEGAQQ